ncbi:hypothetical protein NM688_g3942 [Phlebia brevispora]|uniref:Uncharacterized protein n=1 Tax=Phlebia brevispora TaxID=194682 RepID=A0ACC1T410_9APHY|nr:hypothetical protein NM688_g3942 [Phlebia brevispora]
MALPGVRLQHVVNPAVTQVDAAVDLFVDLMKDDPSLLSLVGGDALLMAPLSRAMLRAGIHSGQYYEATHEQDGLVGYMVTMPPGKDLLSTDEQRALGLTDFMSKLSSEGKEYYKAVYLTQFPAFVNACLGPTGKRDSWYINMLMVRREYQGHGIGKDLVNLICEKASLKGDTVALSTTTDLNATIYQKMGLTLLDRKIMPSPWGDWPLYILSLKTNIPN